uniref:SCP domain-containing protein n=1 Tax=Ascaris lumbricoides TaxID=6252 RepID=A0A0M3I6A1_ASCLU
MNCFRMNGILMQTALLLVILCLLSDSKSIPKKAIIDEDMTASELIDSFLERAKATTHHHHKSHRRHKSMPERVHLVSIDKDGREYVNCVKSINGSLATVKRCYRPQSEDMRVGCYAVWDVKKQLLVQDCWMQQAVCSFANQTAFGRYIIANKQLIKAWHSLRRFIRNKLDCYSSHNLILPRNFQIHFRDEQISMNNCEERRCAAKRSTFCCCYGHTCNEQFDLSNNSFDNL